jgi:methylenetetrahydrofolate--tRNA-(uracil-5-)-methyltransferase
VPAGSALAVDRDGFSGAVEAALSSHPRVTIVREEIAGLPPDDWDSVVVATGPLTSPALADALRALSGEEALAFFDAIAPIVHKDSIDFSVAWMQSRWDRSARANPRAQQTTPPDGGARANLSAHDLENPSQNAGDKAGDYVNCPLTRAQYDAFVDALLAAEKVPFREWEKDTPYFEGCLPIEVMTERGRETLAFGPMKPVGLINPHPGAPRHHAVVQLRQDNALGTLYNMVGFQTKMTYGEQVRIFRTIPGLERAEFARLGGVHRNTFLNSPRLLDDTLRLKARPSLRFAGQITGCEGYVESAAIGLIAGRFAAAERMGRAAPPPPATTALGALLAHVTGGGHAETFQPMNVNFGLFPPLEAADARGRPLRGEARKRALTARALKNLESWRADPARAPQ